MDLNLLKIFTKVAEAGSLTKASKLLGHPKSKISRDLVKLEGMLELTLLKRSPRGIILTEHGMELLRSIKGPLEDLAATTEGLKSSSGQMKGRIKITAPEDISNHLLTQLIIEFMNIYPDINVELYSTNIILDFKEYEIDLAIRVGKLKDSNLIQRKIADIDVILAASSQYLKSSSKIKKLEDLQHHPLAILNDPYGNPLSKDALKGIPTIFGTNSTIALKDFVTHNKGIATVPLFLCEKEIATKEFSRILPEFNYLRGSLFILSEHSNFVPKHVKVFKDFVFENLKKSFTNFK